jgi:hypothetical protein
MVFLFSVLILGVAIVLAAIVAFIRVERQERRRNRYEAEALRWRMTVGAIVAQMGGLARIRRSVLVKIGLHDRIVEHTDAATGDVVFEYLPQEIGSPRHLPTRAGLVRDFPLYGERR